MVSLNPRYGRLAYEAYANHSEWRSLVSGAELPPWDAMDPEIQQAWIVVAAAVLSGGEMPVPEDQR